ncbi:MAG: AAA family ATPase [Deltaproteobacteria bacterium]|nr:AAA family ATPase [Deltaproteobacteria bacterium]
MASLIIVSGCPGSGKTALAASLAHSHPQGLHLTSDTFYRFPVRLIDPTETESQQQNTTIMRALARATGAFLEGGYTVVLEGVIGPWFLPVVRAELPPVRDTSYIVLRLPEKEALRRVRQRQGHGASHRVRAMVPAFENLGSLEAHALSTLDRNAASVFEAVQEGLREGRFRLSG